MSALPSAPVFSLSVRQSVTRARNVTVFLVTSYISDQVATEPKNKGIYCRQIESHLSLILLCCFLFVTFSMVTISLQTTNSSVLRSPDIISVKTKMKLTSVQLFKVLSISSLLLLLVVEYSGTFQLFIYDFSK